MDSATERFGMRVLDALPKSDYERILSVLDGLVRDAETRQACAQTG